MTVEEPTITNVELPRVPDLAAVTNTDVPVASATVVELPVAPATVVELPAPPVPEEDSEATELRDPRHFQKLRAHPPPLAPPLRRAVPQAVHEPEAPTGTLSRRKRWHPLILIGALFALLALTLGLISASGSKPAEAQSEAAGGKLKKMFDW